MSLFIVITLLVAFFDQLSKLIVETNLYNKSIEIIENIFAFTYLQNKGAAWGILAENNWILMILTPVFILLITVFLCKSECGKAEKICGGLIVGGAFGNYIDRLFRGYIVDFLDFKIWPVFNVADVCIVVGCALLATFWLKNNK